PDDLPTAQRPGPAGLHPPLPARAGGERRRCGPPERRTAIRLGRVAARPPAGRRGRIRADIHRQRGRAAAARRRAAAHHHPDPLIVRARYWRLAGITGGLVCAAGDLPAQLLVRAALGARYTSTLVHDSIVTPFDVRPALAPALAVTAATPVGERWTAQATLDFSSSTLERHDVGGGTTRLGRVSTLAFTVGLRRPLAAGFAASLGVGGVKYFPANATGIFRQGSGAIAGLGAITVEYAPAAGAR